MAKKLNQKQIEHDMKRLAKGIAEAEFAQEILRIERINKTLSNHPEFDRDEFIELVKEFKKKIQDKVHSIQLKEVVRWEDMEGNGEE